MRATCFPGLGVKTGYTIGQDTISLHDLTGQMKRSATADGSLLWAAFSVLYGTAALDRCSLESLTLIPGWDTAANATPQVWVDMGPSVRLWPAPSASLTLTVQGFVTPPPVTSVDFTWIPDDLAEPVELYAALQIALKNQEDDILQERIPSLMQRFDARILQLWKRMTPSLKLRFCPDEPTFLNLPQGNA